MTNLDTAKLKILQESKKYDFLTFDDVVNVAVEFGVDVIPLVEYLETSGTNVYESLEAAEEDGQIVLWDDLKERFLSLEKYCYRYGKSHGNEIYYTDIFKFIDEYELELDSDQVDRLVAYMYENGIKLINDSKKFSYDVNENDDAEDDDDEEECESFKNEDAEACYIVDPSYLKQQCDSPNTFEKGMLYYEWKRVLRGSIKDGLISADVQGTHLYNVTAQITKNKIVSHTCTCPAHQTYDGPCKHVVASILWINAVVDLTRKRLNGIIRSFNGNSVIYLLKDGKKVTADNKPKVESVKENPKEPDIFILPYYLKSQCENEEMFEKGKQFYDDCNDRVKQIYIETEDNKDQITGADRRYYTLRAKVVGAGSHLNDVSVSFVTNRINCKCDCEYASKSVGPCKHAIAALFAMNDIHYKNIYNEASDLVPHIVIGKGFPYRFKDLDEIAFKAIESIKSDYSEDGNRITICDEDFDEEFENYACLAAEDNELFSKYNRDYLFNKGKEIAEKAGIEICTEPDDGPDPDCYDTEPDEEWENGFEDEFDESDSEVDNGYLDDLRHDN